MHTNYLQAILDEGGNPEECLIIPSGGMSKSVTRKNGGTYAFLYI